MVFIRLDLPQPLSPTTAMVSPPCSSKETPSTARTYPAWPKPKRRSSNHTCRSSMESRTLRVSSFLSTTCCLVSTAIVKLQTYRLSIRWPAGGAGVQPALDLAPVLLEDRRLLVAACKAEGAAIGEAATLRQIDQAGRAPGNELG